MNWGKHVVEAATLIIAAILCAMVSNAIASRERKLVVLPAASGARAASSEQRAASGVAVASAPITPQPPVTTQATTDNRQPTTATPPATVNRQPATGKQTP